MLIEKIRKMTIEEIEKLGNKLSEEMVKSLKEIENFSKEMASFLQYGPYKKKLYFSSYDEELFGLDVENFCQIYKDNDKAYDYSLYEILDMQEFVNYVKNKEHSVTTSYYYMGKTSGFLESLQNTIFEMQQEEICYSFEELMEESYKRTFENTDFLMALVKYLYCIYLFKGE